MLDSITEPKLLIVEGPDDQYLFEALIKQIGVEHIQVQNVGGTPGFRPALSAIVSTPGFRDLVSIGLVRDANSSDADAARSLTYALADAGLPVPSAPLEFKSGDPRVAFLIVPHGQKSGILEDVCLASTESDPAMSCVDGYFSCIDEHITDLPNNLSKARVQAFLASRKEPGKLLGQAASAGYWNWDHPAFDPLKQLVSML